MKIFVKLCFIFGLVMSSSVLFAHPGGHGDAPQLVAVCKKPKECQSSEIKEGSIKVFNYLRKSYIWSEGWDQIAEPIWVKEKRVSEQAVWVAAFQSAKVLNPKDQNFYIIISPDGFYLGTTSDISEFKDLTNYNWILGIPITLIVSGIVYFFIRKIDDKSEFEINSHV